MQDPSFQNNRTFSTAHTLRKKHVVGIVISIAALVLVVGYIFGGRGSGDQAGSESRESATDQSPSGIPAVPSGSAPRESFLSVDDPTWGPRNAAVTVVEFSDFECPYCRDVFPTVRTIMQRFGDRVLFQYRDFPVSDSHEFAQKAAEAAQCAHAQGKFWEYHDRLFQNQNDLSREALTRYALMVNLDVAAFNRCLDGGTKTLEVLQDFQDGVTAGLKGTPTFFINGMKYEGVLSEEEFVEIIEGFL